MDRYWVLGGILALTLYAMSKVPRNETLTPRQKLFQAAFAALVPLVGPITVLLFSSESAREHGEVRQPGRGIEYDIGDWPAGRPTDQWQSTSGAGEPSAPEGETDW
jgi:hypothetical protein